MMHKMITMCSRREIHTYFPSVLYYVKLYNMCIVYTKLVGRGAREKRAKEGRKEAPPAVNES